MVGGIAGVLAKALALLAKAHALDTIFLMGRVVPAAAAAIFAIRAVPNGELPLVRHGPAMVTTVPGTAVVPPLSASLAVRHRLR